MAVFDSTCRNPSANTAETPTFFLEGICNRQILSIGSTKIKISDVMLIQAVTMTASLMLTQCPGMAGLKILLRGTH